MATRTWVTLRTVTPVPTTWKWNTTDDSNSSEYWNDTDSYWYHRNEPVDANTTCSFVFSTLGDQDYFKDNILYVQIIPAIILMLFFAFVAKSGRPLRSLFRCRAAVPVPVRLNEQHDHRGLICTAFGIAIWSVMQIIFGGKSVYEWNYQTGIHAMLMILHCVLVGVVYWPVMAGINTSYLPGQIIGCIYIWWCAICAVLISLPCEFALADTIIVGIEMLPLYVFLLYICIAMLIRMIRGIRERRKRSTGNWIEEHKDLYQVQHVRRMMRLTMRKTSMEENDFAVNSLKPAHGIDKIKTKIVDGDNEEKAESDKTREEKDLDAVNEREKKILNARFYKNLPGFRYSLNILVAVTITQTAVFLLAASGFRYHTVLLDAAIRFIGALSAVMSATPQFLTGNKTVPVIEIAERMDKDAIRGYARTPIFTSIIFAYLLNLWAMLLTMRNYRKHLVYLYHGQHVKIPEYNKIKSAAAILTTSTKYIGYQLGYGIYAYFVQMFWLILILGGLWTCFILIVVYGRTGILLQLVKHILPIVVYILVMKIGQKLLVYYFFCQKIENKKKDHTVLAIDNRHCYMNYHYFMVFFNAPLGMLNAFGRVIKMLIFSLWTMPRCDIPSLSREFEVMDSAFRTYVCMLTMENSLTNPLLVVFTQHLCDAVRHTNEHLEDVTGTKHEEKQGLAAHSSKRPSLNLSSRSKLARNRWHLLYSLYNNPILRAYRSHTTETILPMTITLSREPGTFLFKREERLVRINNNDSSPERGMSRDSSRNGQGRTIIKITQSPRRY